MVSCTQTKKLGPEIIMLLNCKQEVILKKKIISLWRRHLQSEKVYPPTEKHACDLFPWYAAFASICVTGCNFNGSSTKGVGECEKAIYQFMYQKYV